MAEYNRRPDGISVEPESGETRTAPVGQTGDGGGQTQEYANQARDKAQEYGEQAKEKAQEMGQRAQEQAEAGKDQAASGMERAADMVRERTSGTSGVPAQAGEKVADSVEGAAAYLREHNTSEMLNDLETFARNHPAQAVAGAVAAGFILGRILR